MTSVYTHAFTLTLYLGMIYMVYIRSFFLSVALVMTFVSHCWAVSVPSDKYRTIQAAITALENNSILGDTINVARGEYSEKPCAQWCSHDCYCR